ncbi:MAG TPA: DUF2461 domain-containing protein [Ignavibacteriaceae bacterium]|jgi:uncharacterized protein (TIGR02453 family)
MNKALKLFPNNTAAFLSKLSKNNNREWFEKNREFFNSDFLEPAVQFVAEMGEKLVSLDPEIVAIPKTDKSIFRLHRDVRFSKNKEPYKTNMGLFFWNGRKKKMDGSGFYFHLEPKYFFVGVGNYMFPKELLKKFRDVIADPVPGKELDLIVKKLRKKGFKIGGKKFKKIPRGYDPNSPFAEYFLHDGIHVYTEENDLKKLSGNPVEYVFRLFKEMQPLHHWLVKRV